MSTATRFLSATVEYQASWDDLRPEGASSNEVKIVLTPNVTASHNCDYACRLPPNRSIRFARKNRLRFPRTVISGSSKDAVAQWGFSSIIHFGLSLFGEARDRVVLQYKFPGNRENNRDFHSAFSRCSNLWS
jgi:hypothetical protein